MLMGGGGGDFQRYKTKEGLNGVPTLKDGACCLFMSESSGGSKSRERVVSLHFVTISYADFAQEGNDAPTSNFGHDYCDGTMVRQLFLHHITT